MRSQQVVANLDKGCPVGPNCNPSGAEGNRVEAHKKFARKLDKSTLEVRKLVEDVDTNFASLFSHWQLGRKQYLQHSTSRAFASDG